MKHILLTITVLALLASLAGDASALTRPEVITRARQFTTVSWSISDRGPALYDSPLYRYAETGKCDSHSPLVEWIANYNEGRDSANGAAYAYGGRQTPVEATNWVADGVKKAIGLCEDQWKWREGHGKSPYCFSGNDDCVGVAGYATQWRSWTTQGTSAMHEDAQSRNGYYTQLCAGACEGTVHGYEEPLQADLCVNPGVHVFVWESGDWTTSSNIIEGTGNAAYERAVEHTTSKGYEDWVSDIYWGISVKGILENPRCAFRSVRCPAPNTVEFTTGWTHNTWGFAVVVSYDDGKTWTKIGDYLRAKNPDSTEPQTWTWHGTLPATGEIAVVEIEGGTQRLQQSPMSFDLGAEARR